MRRLWGVVIATLVLFSFNLDTARADGLSDLATQLKISPEPTHFVVLVDTSVSMRDGGRWPAVRQALAGLADKLGEKDHVTLITFDDGVRSTWRADSPTSQALLAKLPATPSGTQTDIGAAIDAGVKALAGRSSNTVAAMVLLTDGQLDPGPSSAYPTATAKSWDALRSRATAASKGKQVGAFAVSLGPDSDANLLTKVFPSARTATPPDIVGYLSGINTEVTKVRVAEALSADLATPVTVTLDDVKVTGTTVTATAHWASSAKHLPVTVASVAGQSGGRVTMEPATLGLEPGATATSTITLTGVPAGQSKQAITATLDSPWAAGLKQAGLALPKPVTSGAVDVTVDGEASASAEPSPTAAASSQSSAPAGGGPTSTDLFSLLPVAGGVLAALLALVVVLAVVRSRRPKLDGSLALLDDGLVTDEFVLDGPSMHATRGETRVQVAARKDGGVLVKGKQGKATFSQVLSDGESIDLGDGRTLRYTAQRTRMLDMVQG